MRIWMLFDYGTDEYGPCRRVSFLELNTAGVVEQLNLYRSPDDKPRITYFWSEGDARAAAANLEVKE